MPNAIPSTHSSGLHFFALLDCECSCCCFIQKRNNERRISKLQRSDFLRFFVLGACRGQMRWILVWIWIGKYTSIHYFEYMTAPKQDKRCRQEQPPTHHPSLNKIQHFFTVCPPFPRWTNSPNRLRVRSRQNISSGTHKFYHTGENNTFSLALPDVINPRADRFPISARCFHRKLAFHEFN